MAVCVDANYDCLWDASFSCAMGIMAIYTHATNIISETWNLSVPARGFRLSMFPFRPIFGTQYNATFGIG